MHHYCLNCLLRFKLIQRRHGLWVVTIWRLCRSARVQSNKGAMVNKTGGTVASTFYTQDYFAPKIYVFFIHVLTLLTRIIDGPPMGSNLHCLRTQSILDSLTNYFFITIHYTISFNGNPLKKNLGPLSILSNMTT